MARPGCSEEHYSVLRPFESSFAFSQSCTALGRLLTSRGLSLLFVSGRHGHLSLHLKGQLWSSWQGAASACCPGGKFCPWDCGLEERVHSTGHVKADCVEMSLKTGQIFRLHLWFSFPCWRGLLEPRRVLGKPTGSWICCYCACLKWDLDMSLKLLTQGSFP